MYRPTWSHWAIVLLAAGMAAAAPAPVPPNERLESSPEALAKGEDVSPTGKETKPAMADDDTVTWDTGATVYIDSEHRWHMSGGVTFRQDDAVLQTDSAIVNVDSDLHAHDAQSIGPVHMYDPQDDITADRGSIDFTTHTATLKGHVTLINRPGSGKSATGATKQAVKQPATVTCDNVVYDYRHKTGVIPGALTVFQKDRTLTADSGQYDGYRKTVTLTGHVHGKTTDGSVVDSSELVAGIQDNNQWISVPQPVHGVWKLKKGEAGTTDQNPGPTPAPEPPPIPPDATASPSTGSPAPATQASPAPTAAGTSPGVGK